MRVKIIRIIISILFLIIIADLFYAQGIRGNYFYNLSINNRIRVIPVEGTRGRILDRNGLVLAENKTSFNVTITPQDVQDEGKLFNFLAEILKIDKKKLIETYYQRKLTSFTPVVVAQDIGREKAILIEENKFLYPSLYIEESYLRFYPQKEYCSHLLGYVGKINKERSDKYKKYGYTHRNIVGYSGLEEYYDSYLTGETGGLQIEVNNRGEQVRLLGIKEASQGKEIVTTIDLHIQQIVYDLLNGKAGSIVVMDMDNGEILGLVSAPSYDPNIFISQKDKNSISGLFSDPRSPLLNRAIKGAFPPGSLFKIPAAICGLDMKKINQWSTFFCGGFYELAGSRFGCTHRHENQNLEQALAHSCNVYFYHLGLILGADNIGKYASILGLGNYTNIDLPYEENGHIPNRSQRLLSPNKHWYTGDTLNFVIGQGDILVTPIQLVKMISIVAKEGKIVWPHVIKKINDVEINKNSAELKIDKSVFSIVKKGLRAAVSSQTGTANILNIEGLKVSGKTGTAQTSGTKDHHAWFLGYVEGKKNLAFCVFLEHGGSSHNACLVSQQLLSQLKKIGII